MSLKHAIYMAHMKEIQNANKKKSEVKPKTKPYYSVKRKGSSREK